MARGSGAVDRPRSHPGMGVHRSSRALHRPSINTIHPFQPEGLRLDSGSGSRSSASVSNVDASLSSASPYEPGWKRQSHQAAWRPPHLTGYAQFRQPPLPADPRFSSYPTGSVGGTNWGARVRDGNEPGEPGLHRLIRSQGHPNRTPPRHHERSSSPHSRDHARYREADAYQYHPTVHRLAADGRQTTNRQYEAYEAGFAAAMAAYADHARENRDEQSGESFSPEKLL